MPNVGQVFKYMDLGVQVGDISQLNHNTFIILYGKIRISLLSQLVGLGQD